MMMPLPELVVHADWSIHPKKRIMMMARWQNGRYHLYPPQQLPQQSAIVPYFKQQLQADSSIFFGVDFPIGLPRLYAKKAQITNFMQWLPKTQTRPWSTFYDVAEQPDEIGLKRPFYPKRPGGTLQKQLLNGLGFEDMSQLRRQCDFARPGRRAAAPLFWTMGAQQVGKAAITGWRNFILPNLEHIHIWPFSGRLADLLKQDRIVVAEAYPAEVYDWLGVNFGSRQSKRNQEARRAQSEALKSTAVALNVKILPETQLALATGFDSEDAFDACVGVLGMLKIVLGKRPLFEPTDPIIQNIEGWILGQAPSR